MKEGMGQPGKRLLTATAKVWRFGLGQKFVVFCNSYNTPTLFQNLQKTSLTKWEWQSISKQWFIVPPLILIIIHT